MLPQVNRLRDGEDFRKTVRRGKRTGGRYVVAHALTESTRASVRVGFVVSKAVGNAVIRNLVKRRMRGASAELIKDRSGVDIVFRALPAAAHASYGDLHNEMRTCLTRIEARS